MKTHRQWIGSGLYHSTVNYDVVAACIAEKLRRKRVLDMSGKFDSFRVVGR